jgi:3-methyl-2-oxobutanoate hydroxymethyltransferase
MNESNIPRTLSVEHLFAMKRAGEKIAMLTCYDASFARAMDQAGVDIVLVGDSLGMVLQGRKTTVGVTVEDVAYHVECVSRGLQRAFLLADLPFGGYYDETVAVESAVSLMQAGAAMVKLEGAGPMIGVVDYLTARGIPVCGHLGLTPQSVHQLGGFKVQARDQAAAARLRDDALALQEAGAQLLVLECVPASLAAEVAGALRIPVIGIGAGGGCDGQVLVMHDMLGLGERAPRFVADFLAGAGSIRAAFAAYVRAVRSGDFPAAEHAY